MVTGAGMAGRYPRTPPPGAQPHVGQLCLQLQHLGHVFLHQVIVLGEVQVRPQHRGHRHHELQVSFPYLGQRTQDKVWWPRPPWPPWCSLWGWGGHMTESSPQALTQTGIADGLFLPEQRPQSWGSPLSLGRGLRALCGWHLCDLHQALRARLPAPSLRCVTRA